MSLPSFFTAFSQFMHSPQFRDLACHTDAGNAFVRTRKLPLPALVAVMLSGMRRSVQTELDEFFAHLKELAQLVHHVSEQAFAKARAKLSTTAIPALNDWLIERADADGFVPRWRGRRLVAVQVALDRLHQDFGQHTVKSGQLGIEHDLLIDDDQNARAAAFSSSAHFSAACTDIFGIAP